MHPTDWNAVLAMSGVFADILVKGKGEINRGPVAKVYRRPGYIVFDSIWLAGAKATKTGSPDWKKLHGTETVVPADVSPSFDMSGVLTFELPGVGEVLVYRKHTGEYLDPELVDDLSGDDIRKTRAWMYDIPLDSSWEKIIDRVVSDLGSDGLTSYEEQILVQDEAAKFAA